MLQESSELPGGCVSPGSAHPGGRGSRAGKAPEVGRAWGAHQHIGVDFISLEGTAQASSKESGCVCPVFKWKGSESAQRGVLTEEDKENEPSKVLSL